MMSDVRWKVSLLFAILTVSIFFSIYLNSGGVLEGIANQTKIQGANSSNSSVSNVVLIPDLINKLETGDNGTKFDAATQLGRLGKPAANALIERIETNNSSSEKANSFMLLALLETGDQRTEEILFEKLGKNVTSNNTTAESTFEGQAGRQMSDDTLQAMEAKDREMKKRLADSIDRDYGNKTDVLENALKLEEQNASIYTSIALSEFGPQEPGNETEKLFKALKSESGPTRVAAMMALGERKEKAAVDPLTNVILKDYPLAKNSAIISLGEIGDKGAQGVLQKQMQSDSEYTRSCTAIALGKIGTDESLPYLIAKLRDSSAGVRSNSALALGRIGNETAVEPLIGILESGRSHQGKANDSINAVVDVRKSAILALGEIGGTRATEALNVVLIDKEERSDVKMTAALALGETGDSKALETLKMLIDDKTVDNKVKKSVLLALGKNKNKEVAGILIGKLGDKEFGATATNALVNMGEIAVDPLIGNLNTKDRRAKNETALTLIEIGDPRAIKPLIQAYK
jgi:HEAT repeat protein